jgi:hypothetical protein
MQETFYLFSVPCPKGQVMRVANAAFAAEYGHANSSLRSTSIFCFNELPGRGVFACRFD